MLLKLEFWRYLIVPFRFPYQEKPACHCYQWQATTRPCSHWWQIEWRHKWKNCSCCLWPWKGWRMRVRRGWLEGLDDEGGEGVIGRSGWWRWGWGVTGWGEGEEGVTGWAGGWGWVGGDWMGWRMRRGWLDGLEDEDEEGVAGGWGWLEGLEDEEGWLDRLEDEGVTGRAGGWGEEGVTGWAGGWGRGWLDGLED